MPDFNHPVHGRVNNVQGHMGYTQSHGWSEIKPYAPPTQNVGVPAARNLVSLGPGMSGPEIARLFGFLAALAFWVASAAALRGAAHPHGHSYNPYDAHLGKLFSAAVFFVVTCGVLWVIKGRKRRWVLGAAAAVMLFLWA
jgi:hypothetical protein